MAFDRDEIINHNGICGIDSEEWEASPVYAAQKAVAETVAEAKAAPEVDSRNTYEIYQLKGGQEMREYMFEAYSRLKDRGLAVNIGNYELVYTAPLAPADNLDSIYEKFNLERPADFRGHSLSMSDVIVLKQDGAATSHYVDSAGFKQLSDFTGQEKQPELAQQAPPPAYTGPSVAEITAQAQAGQQVSLLELANAQKAERQTRAPDKKPATVQASQNSRSKSEKPSLLARLHEAQKEAAQGREQGNNEPKRNTNREV